MDHHHIAGRANSPITTSVPVNDHRAELSAAQMDWPQETLRNPDGCPLRKGAAHIRGFVDMVKYYMDKFLAWPARLLELLSDFLKEKLGNSWWTGTPINQFTNGGTE